MRARLSAFVVVVVLALVGVVLHRRHREAARIAGHRAAAERSLALLVRLDRCLLGDAPPREEAAMVARARRIALHPATPSTWPRGCAPEALAIVDAVRSTAWPPTPLTRASEHAMTLTRALTDAALEPSLRAFRVGDGDAHVADWVAPLASLRGTARALAGAYGLRAPTTTSAGPAALAARSGDVIPVSVTPGAVVAGTSFAAGTLSVFFVEPTRERVFCRSRDRGATLDCTRFGPEGTPRYLFGNDDPEALLLRASAPTEPSVLVAADAPDVAVFSLGLPLVSSLAARVSGGGLLAVADVSGVATLLRCARGGACARTPLDVPAVREGAVVSTGRARWWFGVVGAEGALGLDARRIPADASAPLEAAVRVAPLRTSAALLSTCHAAGVAYVAVSDAPGTHLVAVEGDGAPRALGALDAIDMPVELVCDAQGATVVGASRVQSCEREGGCSPHVTVEGTRRFARVGGELVMVSVTRDGGEGLRVRHGPPARIQEATSAGLDDDAAHGGLSARALWLFTADDRVVLFATGATTAVLWSDDRGVTWHPAREPVEALRPARLGALPRSNARP